MNFVGKLSWGEDGSKGTPRMGGEQPWSEVELISMGER